MVDYAHEVQTFFRLLWKYGNLSVPEIFETSPGLLVELTAILVPTPSPLAHPKPKV